MAFSEQTNNDTRLLKVAVFAATPMAIPAINLLFEQGRLAGVVLPPTTDEFTVQLGQWLQQQDIGLMTLAPDKTEDIVNSLKRWESSLAIAIGFAPNLPSDFYHGTLYGLFYLLSASPDAHHGSMPTYWQIRGGYQTTALTLVKGRKLGHEIDIVSKIDVAIDSLDTLQSTQNKLTQQVPLLIGDFLQQMVASQGEMPLQTLSNQGVDSPSVEQHQLYVQWNTMKSREITNLARAGNPNLGGCIICCCGKEINLLQATTVKHATYGVKPGTICYISEPEGVIVACVDGAIRLDILSNIDGIFSAINFVERFGISAGMAFESPPTNQTKG